MYGFHMTGQGCSHRWAWEGINQPIMSFSPQNDFITGRNSPQFHQLSWCWSQTIPQVKMPDVEVLGWCGYMWSAVVRPVGRTAK